MYIIHIYRYKPKPTATSVINTIRTPDEHIHLPFLYMTRLPFSLDAVCVRLTLLAMLLSYMWLPTVDSSSSIGVRLMPYFVGST
jgi:hypothetical protein